MKSDYMKKVETKQKEETGDRYSFCPFSLIGRPNSASTKAECLRTCQAWNREKKDCRILMVIDKLLPLGYLDK